jgi:polyhydroxyalkanoate synthesis regulator phasin
MDEPGSSRSSLLELIEETFYAGVGAVALTKDRVDELVDELTSRGRLSRTEARQVVDEMTGRWRGEALRFGERTSSSLTGVLRELGVVTRREWEELELRLSQVEHRLRLLETSKPPSPPGPSS